VDITVIALWLGHEQLSTTNVYLVCQKLHQMGEPNASLRQLGA
jgi:site-specific recombinase XerD